MSITELMRERGLSEEDEIARDGNIFRRILKGKNLRRRKRRL
jgi:hypothetical protein